jgi:hypothetical protein
VAADARRDGASEGGEEGTGGVSAALDVSQSFEQEADEALREAHSVSELNATTGELYGIPRWYRSPAARALEDLAGTSAGVRARRLSEQSAWGIAIRLFAADGASSAEIEGIERQCDLDRVLVLPVRVGKKPADLGGADKIDAAYPEGRAHRLSLRTPDGAALASRLWDKDPVFGLTPSALVRSTHRLVHRALAGTGEGLGSPGCKWCKG